VIFFFELAPGGTAGAETGGRGGGSGWGVGVTQYGWYCWKALLQAVILVLILRCGSGCSGCGIGFCESDFFF
jgi:hypothetical protein